MGEQEHYLLSQRDEAEKARLNFQGTVIEAIRSNQIFEPTITIPKTSIRRVADVATGTGIWLENAKVELLKSGNTDADFIGFDISGAQFPKNPKENMKFVVSDINQGFAEEWHGTFDIVHVRLLVLVLTVDQYEHALRNILKLLKPGGFLQWTDLDFLSNEPLVYPVINSTLSCAQEGNTILSFWASQNWDKNIISCISRILQTSAVEDIHTKQYIDNCFSKPELQPMLLEWHRGGAMAILKMMNMRMGRSEVDAEGDVRGYGRKVGEMGKMGMVFPIPIATLTARKI